MNLIHISKDFNDSFIVDVALMNKWKEKVLLLSEYFISSSVVLHQLNHIENHSIIAFDGKHQDVKEYDIHLLIDQIDTDSFENKAYSYIEFKKQFSFGSRTCSSALYFPIYLPNGYFFGVIGITNINKDKIADKYVKLCKLVLEVIEEDLSKMIREDNPKTKIEDYIHEILYRNSDNISCFFNEYNQLHLFNKKFKKLFIGNAEKKVKPQAKLDAFLEALKPLVLEVEKSHKQKVYATDYDTANGVIRLSTTLKPIFNNKKEYLGVQAVSVDITAELLEMHDSGNNKIALQEYERIYKMLANPICLCNLEGNFIKVNPAFTSLLGYSQDELMGKSIFDFVHPDDANETAECIREKSITQPEIIHLENRLLCKTGEIVWLSWVVQSIYKQGISYAIAHDISNLKNIEAELIEAKEKAEKSDQLKTAFLCNMSHEIRTPMNGIIGFADLLQSLNADDEYLKYYCNMINNSSQQLLQIVNDVIDISKIEVGEVDVSKKEISINPILSDLIKSYKAKGEEKGIDIKIKNPKKKEGVSIYTDEIKLNQILENLITNAIKFTKEGAITIGYKPMDKKVLFYVEDTGIGIPKNKQKQIFNRFYQLTVHDKKIEGTGLGLAICKAFVNELGGDIWVESEEGKGSIFKFVLPNK